MNKENLKYLDCDLYRVYMENGEKQIQVKGWCYENENGYQHVYCSGCDFSVREIEGCYDKASVFIEECKQYQDDVEEAFVCEYYDGATVLRMDQVTQETPCGLYIDDRFAGNEKRTMAKIKVYFAGVDYWSRPVFKSIDGKHYYCDTEHLVNGNVKESEILDWYKTNGTSSIIFKGRMFDSEPEGDCVDIEIVPYEEAKKEREST